MREGTGRPVFSGVAIGRAYVYRHQQAELPGSCGDAANDQCFHREFLSVGKQFQGIIIICALRAARNAHCVPSVFRPLRRTGRKFSATFKVYQIDRLCQCRISGDHFVLIAVNTTLSIQGPKRPLVYTEGSKDVK